MSAVQLKTLRPLDRCRINGFLCEVTRQARRTTYVRVLDERLPGRCVVQLDRSTVVYRRERHQDAVAAGP